MSSETAALNGSAYLRKTGYGTIPEQKEDNDIVLEPTDQKTSEVSKQAFGLQKACAEEYRMCAKVYQENKYMSGCYIFIGTILWALGLASAIVSINENKSPFNAPVLSSVGQGAFFLGIGLGIGRAVSSVHKV